MAVLFEGSIQSEHQWCSLLCPGIEFAEGFACFLRQKNGLLGAAQSGALLLRVGVNTGPVRLAIELWEEEPSVENFWEEVVETSFVVKNFESGTAVDNEPVDLIVLQTYGQKSVYVTIPSGAYRVRMAALNYGTQDMLEDEDEEAESKERYALVFWPSSPRPDEVIKSTRPEAAHRIHRQTKA